MTRAIRRGPRGSGITPSISPRSAASAAARRRASAQAGAAEDAQVSLGSRRLGRGGVAVADQQAEGPSATAAADHAHPHADLVASGEFDVIGIQHQAEGSKRQTTLWCAKKLDYLPVVIEQHRKGKLRVRATLRRYTPKPDLPPVTSGR